MPEWLTGGPLPAGALAPELVALRLVQAACLGFLVAAVYFATQRKKRVEASSFVATLVLLTVLIAMVSQVIGDSVARAFSLVGALSIVRFRTVVEDTRDTAFVIFAVIVGMAAGTGTVNVALIGLPIVAVVAGVLSFWGRDPEVVKRPTLVVKLAVGLDPAAALGGVFAKHLAEFKLTKTETAKQGAALELTYAVQPKTGSTAVAIVTDLHKTEGVAGVEWSEPNGKK
jgi:hypothetical protein